MIEGEEGATPADEIVQQSVRRRTFLKGGAVAGATLMVGGVLAACGAADDSSGGGDAAASGDGGGGSKADYVIGCLYPLTGPNAADGEQMTNGSDLAVQEINAAGGVGGRMIKREVLDTDITSPEQIQQNYQKLIDMGADAVINGYLLSWDAAMDIAAQYGAPFLNASTSQAQCDMINSDPKYNCVFQIDPPETWYGKGFPKFLNDLEATGAWKPRNKKIYIVEGNVPYSQVISKVTQETAPEYGWEIAGVEPMGAGAMADWGPILSKVKAADAAVVMNTHYMPSELATFTIGFAADPTDSLFYVQYGASVPEYLSSREILPTAPSGQRSRASMATQLARASQSGIRRRSARRLATPTRAPATTRSTCWPTSGRCSAIRRTSRRSTTRCARSSTAVSTVATTCRRTSACPSRPRRRT